MALRSAMAIAMLTVALMLVRVYRGLHHKALSERDSVSESFSFVITSHPMKNPKPNQPAKRAKQHSRSEDRVAGETKQILVGLTGQFDEFNFENSEALKRVFDNLNKRYPLTDPRSLSTEELALLDEFYKLRATIRKQLRSSQAWFALTGELLEKIERAKQRGGGRTLRETPDLAVESKFLDTAMSQRYYYLRPDVIMKFLDDSEAAEKAFTADVLRDIDTKATVKELLDALTARGLRRETRLAVENDIANFGRPKWEDEDLPKELRGITAPAFLKIAWKDRLGDNLTISKKDVRDYDPLLMSTIESYISKRVARKAKGLGDAEGITFNVDEAKSTNISGGYRRLKARSAAPS